MTRLSRSTLLLIPFFSWGIVDFLITDKGMSFIGFIVDLVENPDKGLWFLWVLFFIMLSHAGLSKLFSRVKLFISSVFVILFIYFLKLEGVNIKFGVDLYAWHLFFYASGYLWKECRLYKLGYSRKLFSWLLLLLYFFSFLFWERSLDGYGPMYTMFLLIVKYCCAISAILLFVINISFFNVKNEIVSFLSKQSLSFYAIQTIVISIVLGFFQRQDLFTLILLTFFVSTFLSYIAILIINRLPISLFRKTIFGR
ncbi:hypothetical protein BTO03_25705 [Vibrio parahaemolyticus]|nr:hypothetical protein BTO03_25705 [Vibrio parahaemolyticus]